MFAKLMYLIRFFIKVKLNRQIKANSIVLIQKKAKLITEEGAEIIIGERVLIKESTIIYAKKNSRVVIGDNTSTGHHSEISCNDLIKIGSDVIMGAYTYITDSNHGSKNKDLPIRKQLMETEKVVISDNVWLGRGVMLLKGAKLGNNTIVAAGAIVTKEFEGNIVLGGVPAKKIKDYF